MKFIHYTWNRIKFLSIDNTAHIYGNDHFSFSEFCGSMPLVNPLCGIFISIFCVFPIKSIQITWDPFVGKYTISGEKVCYLLWDEIKLLRFLFYFDENSVFACLSQRELSYFLQTERATHLKQTGLVCVLFQRMLFWIQYAHAQMRISII